MFLLLGLAVLSAALGVALRFPPEWKSEVGFSWKKLNLISMLVAVGLVALAGGIAQDIHDLRFVSLPPLIFLLTQSIFTDFSARLVYRHPVNLVNVSVGVFLTVWLYIHGRQDISVLIVVFALSFLALLMFPKLINQADTRALITLVAVAMPVMPFDLFTRGLFGTVVALLVYRGLVLVRDLRKPGVSFKEALLTKVSIPAVPFFLAPTTVLVWLTTFV